MVEEVPGPLPAPAPVAGAFGGGSSGTCARPCGSGCAARTREMRLLPLNTAARCCRPSLVLQLLILELPLLLRLQE